MNPPINRDNLRDVLIALVVATGLAWVVGVFEGCAANTPPSPPSIMAQRVSSDHERARADVLRCQGPEPSTRSRTHLLCRHT